MPVDRPADRYPIVIVGGGMVGVSCALAIQKRVSVPVLIVEAAAVESKLESPSFDARSTAIAYGTRKNFETLDLWQPLAGHGEPIRQIQVSDRGRFGQVTLSADELKVEALGYVLGNADLGRVLHENLQRCNHIEVLSSAQTLSVTPTVKGMQVLIQSSDARATVHADLVILADGGRSPLMSTLGIGSDIHDYGQTAIIANVGFESPHDGVAYERFTEQGPLAMLPLPTFDGEPRGAMVWTASHADAQSLLSLPPDQFLESLQMQFGWRLGRMSRVGARFAYPLIRSIAREQIRPRLVLLGNVAHTLHPVAGQGFNLALRDAMVLADVVAKSLSGGEDPGAVSVLQRYLDHRQVDQDWTIGMTHQLTQLFSSAKASRVWARKLGLATVDLLPPVRRSFARHAMGLAEIY